MQMETPWCNPADRWADFLVWDHGRRGRVNADIQTPTLFVQRRISREARCHVHNRLNVQGGPKIVGRYQIIKKIILNRITARQ